MLVRELTDAFAGRYTIERELGTGGMATVYLARDAKHDRLVALKVLRPDLAASIGTERFLQEIRITARLAHPHILPLLDSGALPGTLYYVMPFVAGESLRDRLNRERQLGVDAAVQIAQEVADALSYAHAEGVLHRDIKPENILLHRGHALVADFGIARAVNQAAGEHLTRTGTSIGTPTYMSPEQAMGEPGVDQRSDEYSLACVIYEMLVGEPPITGPTAQSIIARKCSEAARPIHATREGVSLHLDAAVARALSRAPADRFETVEQFRLALTSPMVPDAPNVAPVVRVHSSRVTLFALLIGALVLLGVLGVLVPRWRSRSTPPSGPPRIAVLPFELVGRPEDQYFADGITEEIMSRLAGISGLRLVSRTSAKRFQGSRLGARQVGDSLSADYLLEGVVRMDRASDGTARARVTPRLIRVSTDEPVWSSPEIDVSLSARDMFRVQGDIATKVAAAMNVALLEPERRRVARVPTADSEAFRLYQVGRFQWEKRDGASLLRAADYFRQAIARDSNFAKAHAGLADALNIHHELFAPEDRVEGDSAIAAARRAIVLDPTLAEAYATLGFALMLNRMDWTGSDSAFRRSISLDSSYAPAYYWYAQLVSIRATAAASDALSRRATQLDQLSSIAHLVHGLGHLTAGRLDSATSELQRATDLQPASWIGWQFLTLAHLRAGRITDSRRAASEFLKALLPGQSVDSTMASEVLTMFSGRAEPAFAGRFIRRIGANANNALAAFWFAEAGLADSAFARTDSAIRNHSGYLPVVLYWMRPKFEKDPRWPVLVRRVGLTE